MKTTRANLTYILVSMIAGIILLSSLYQYWVQKKVTAEWSRDRAQAEIRLLANDVSTVLKGVTRDLFMLRDLPQLREFLEAKSENYKKRTLSETEKFFVLFARNKKIYDQVRFINEKGREVVRVNFRGEGVEAVRKESLQDKSSRYYFQETISLVPGNVYVSPMDLNIEKGVIERPLKPMIRYATPVTNQEGEKRGIVILNVKAEHILNIIREHQQRARYGERYFLVSRLGYYLFHPDARKAWGFMFGTDNKLVNDEPGLYPLLREQSQGFTTLYNDSLKKDYFYVYQRIYPVTGESNYGVTTDPIIQSDIGYDEERGFFWILLSSVDVDALVPTLRKHTLSMLFFSGALLLGGVFFASLFAWRHSRPIQMLSATASKIADGNLSARVVCRQMVLDNRVDSPSYLQ